MAGILSQETQRTIEASTMFPGFRFSPTDVELISYYLRKKMEGADRCVEVIPEVEICRQEPWDLPAKSVIKSENEWFFFSSRGRKYPNGLQSKRATELGYWKATGKERNVRSGSDVIGTKRTLVFHLGRAPRGERTEWIMHEYSMRGKLQWISNRDSLELQDSLVVCRLRLRRNADFRPNEGSTRASLPQVHLSTTPSSSGGISGGDNEYIGGSEEERAAECSKKYSSHHDSHSIDLLDSASESEQRLSNEFNLAESSSHQKDCVDDDDFYAEILKDDIIKLDETLLSDPPAFLPVVASKFSAEQPHQQPAELHVSQALPLLATPIQGVGRRRIKLRGQTPRLPPSVPVKLTTVTWQCQLEKPKLPREDGQLKCYITAMFHKMSIRQLISLGFIILALLVFICLNSVVRSK